MVGIEVKRNGGQFYVFASTLAFFAIPLFSFILIENKTPIFIKRY